VLVDLNYRIGVHMNFAQRVATGATGQCHRRLQSF